MRILRKPTKIHWIESLSMIVYMVIGQRFLFLIGENLWDKILVSMAYSSEYIESIPETLIWSKESACLKQFVK